LPHWRHSISANRPTPKDDGDDESAKPVPAIPNLYLDMRTNYSTVPAGALSIGFGTTAYSLTVGTPLYAVRN
jgi:hypothetical protein